MNEKRRRASAEPKLTEKRSMKGFGKAEAYGETEEFFQRRWQQRRQRKRFVLILLPSLTGRGKGEGPFYSCLMLSTGLALAACQLWRITARKEARAVMRMARA